MGEYYGQPAENPADTALGKFFSNTTTVLLSLMMIPAALGVIGIAILSFL